MNLDEYISNHSDAEPEYLAKINRATHVKLINPRMCSGHLQGRVLSMFCRMIQPNRILELGTFTGYSALCMAEALPEGGVLHTIECDDELEDFILQNFAGSEYADKIQLHIGDALTEIEKLNETFDLVFIDADKREYLDYYEAVLPKLRCGGYILADNTLWDGKVLKTVEPNDKQTIEIMRFNDFVATDPRVEKVILPLRDGLTLIRKK
ncbi:O-methyltransferase family 3 [Paludibacter propionicigenes WB4]|uniref:O-methyltransferase family 3 n=1 Tax=Paludibacter propionicigenes (strain DSM 17365 / JCM 13257 / WB4) TaxID=694427 RepID=E4T3X7_PALPW|nr:O-methyltransferase [Paludibacter propionicigenes]ADQ79421.1 O-methyltransferase family 3 [Paludibacter propionicigenes WB4]